jgi:hypothetical protein
MSHPLAALAAAEAIMRSASDRRREHPTPRRAEPESVSAAHARPWWSRRARREAVLTRTPAAS